MNEKEVRHLFEGRCIANGVSLETSHGLYYGDLYKVGEQFILDCNPTTREEQKKHNLIYTREVIEKRKDRFEKFDPETVTIIIGLRQIWGMSL